MKPIYLLSDKQIDGVKNLPMIQINTIENKIDIDNYDALIFTSKNSVASLDKISSSWRHIPSYAIAPQTAKVIEKYGGNLCFTGSSGHGDDFAKELIPHLKEKKALYIRGAKVVSNLVEILDKNDIVCDQFIVYETVCKTYSKDDKPPKDSIIIFSSPSTIECFLKNFVWDESYEAVAIGHTTAKYFPQNITPHISATTSLQSCIDLATDLSDL